MTETAQTETDRPKRPVPCRTYFNMKMFLCLFWRKKVLRAYDCFSPQLYDLRPRDHFSYTFHLRFVLSHRGVVFPVCTCHSLCFDLFFLVFRFLAFSAFSALDLDLQHLTHKHCLQIAWQRMGRLSGNRFPIKRFAGRFFGISLLKWINLLVTCDSMKKLYTLWNYC